MEASGDVQVKEGESPLEASATPLPVPAIPTSTPTATTPTSATAPAPSAASPAPAPPSVISQKRILIDDDHAPAVRSPLNPDARPAKTASQPPEDTPMGREKRAKKETFKKRDAKAPTEVVESSKASPGPKRKVAKTNHDLPRPGNHPHPNKAIHFEPPRGPHFESHHRVQYPSGEIIEFFEPTDYPVNRRSFLYESTIADPKFPFSGHFRRTEPAPYTAHFSFQDAPPHAFFDLSGTHITGENGYRTARANVAVRQGRWYWECKITQGCIKDKQPGGIESHGHVRMGWARREASREAPVGYDAYGYGIRDVGGQKVWMSRPKDFFPAGENIEEGDVIGLEIQLPSEHLHRKVVQGSFNPAVDLTDDEVSAEGPNVIRDRQAFLNDKLPVKSPIFCFEKYDYYPVKELEELMNPSPMAGGHSSSSEPPNPNHPVPSLRTLPNSYIKVYKNGKLMGTPFTSLLAFLPPASTANPKVTGNAREGLDDGTLGYYPAVSVFRGGAAEVNFGPNFWFPPPGLQAQSEDTEMAGSEGTQQAAAPVGEAQVHPVSDRYEEQIAEDVVYDIMDETYFWMQSGGRGDQPQHVAKGDSRHRDREQDVVMDD